MLKGNPVGVAANVDVIVVSQRFTSNQRIVVFDYCNGRFIRGFGERGLAPGQLDYPYGLRLTPDGRHIVVAEGKNKRLSMFTISGEFIRVIGATEVGGWQCDVCFASSCDIVTGGYDKHEIIVLSADDDRVLRRFGCEGTDDGQFQYPIAVTFAQDCLYVLDAHSARVQVFE